MTSLLADGFLSPSLIHYWFSGMNDPPTVDFPPSLVMLVMRLTTSTRPVGMAETSAIVSTMNPVITRPLHRTSPTTSLIILQPPFFWPPILALSSPPLDLSTHFPPDLFTTPFNILLGLPPQSPSTHAQVSQSGSLLIKQLPSSEPSTLSKHHVRQPVSKIGRRVWPG